MYGPIPSSSDVNWDFRIQIINSDHVLSPEYCKLICNFVSSYRIINDERCNMYRESGI